MALVARPARAIAAGQRPGPGAPSHARRLSRAKLAVARRDARAGDERDGALHSRRPPACGPERCVDRQRWPSHNVSRDRADGGAQVRVRVLDRVAHLYARHRARAGCRVGGAAVADTAGLCHRVVYDRLVFRSGGRRDVCRCHVVGGRRLGCGAIAIARSAVWSGRQWRLSHLANLDWRTDCHARCGGVDARRHPVPPGRIGSYCCDRTCTGHRHRACGRTRWLAHDGGHDRRCAASFGRHVWMGVRCGHARRLHPRVLRAPRQADAVTGALDCGAGGGALRRRAFARREHAVHGPQDVLSVDLPARCAGWADDCQGLAMVARAPPLFSACARSRRMEPAPRRHLCWVEARFSCDASCAGRLH